jgi:hypothetical protein
MRNEISLLQQVRLREWTWKTGGAVVGLAAGLISPVIGAVLTIITWLTGPHWHRLNLQLHSTIFFVIALPLLLLGAHCLDLIEAQEKRPRW